MGIKVYDLIWLFLELLYNLGIKVGNCVYVFNDNIMIVFLNYRSYCSDVGILIEIECSIVMVI